MQFKRLAIHCPWRSDKQCGALAGTKDDRCSVDNCAPYLLAAMFVTGAPIPAVKTRLKAQRDDGALEWEGGN